MAEPGPCSTACPAGAQAQQPGGSGSVASSFPIGPGETQTDTPSRAAGAAGSAGQAQLLSGIQQQIKSHENL